MAKYSKEQRRCAVELYVRYECCAADVICELGYPSREALRMWHRDWLEEQRTGVPSSRGVNWLLVGFRVHGRHHEITSQKPDRVLHAALLVARVRIAEPDLEPVMRHERGEHPSQRDLALHVATARTGRRQPAESNSNRNSGIYRRRHRCLSHHRETMTTPGKNHQPTLRKNTAEPAQQTLKQYTRTPRSKDARVSLWRASCPTRPPAKAPERGSSCSPRCRPGPGPASRTTTPPSVFRQVGVSCLVMYFFRV